MEWHGGRTSSFTVPTSGQGCTIRALVLRVAGWILYRLRSLPNQGLGAADPILSTAYFSTGSGAGAPPVVGLQRTVKAVQRSAGCANSS